MSKLVKGEIAISDLAIVEEAAERLGWKSANSVHSVRIDIVDPEAKYAPYIRVYDTGEIEYDNWIGGKREDLYTTEHRQGKEDAVTSRVVGQLKQTIALVTLERHLKAKRASWRVEKRADGSQVVYVKA